MNYEQIQSEIVALKSLLSNTDYKALKFAEGQITLEDYNIIRIQRQLWRDRINELEALQEETTWDMEW